VISNKNRLDTQISGLKDEHRAILSTIKALSVELKENDTICQNKQKILKLRQETYEARRSKESSLFSEIKDNRVETDLVLSQITLSASSFQLVLQRR